MKALLISTLLSWSAGYNGDTTAVHQEHIWFEGPAAMAECRRTETAFHFGSPTVYGAEKVSSRKYGRDGTAERKTQCLEFNQ